MYAEFKGYLHYLQLETPRLSAIGAKTFSEIALILKYPEHNGRIDGADPWSIRQTAVYQSFDPLTGASLWILLNPRQNAAADNRIKSLLERSEDFLYLHGHPPLIALVVLSTYFVNWRAYMAYYEKEELRMVCSQSN